jgi:hypothetical protein
MGKLRQPAQQAIAPPAKQAGLSELVICVGGIYASL